MQLWNGELIILRVYPQHFQYREHKDLMGFSLSLSSAPITHPNKYTVSCQLHLHSTEIILSHTEILTHRMPLLMPRSWGQRLASVSDWSTGSLPGGRRPPHVGSAPAVPYPGGRCESRFSGEGSQGFWGESQGCLPWRLLQQIHFAGTLTPLMAVN